MSSIFEMLDMLVCYYSIIENLIPLLNVIWTLFLALFNKDSASFYSVGA